MSRILKQFFLGLIITSVVSNPSLAQKKTDSDATQGVFPVVNSLNGNLGYIDASGRLIIPTEFTLGAGAPYDILPRFVFSEGLAAVAFNDSEYGYIDEHGETVIKPQFSEADTFSEGLAFVEVLRSDPNKSFLHRVFFYINRQGEQAFELPPNFGGDCPPNLYDIPRRFQEGYAIACNTETPLVGFINKLGKLEIGARFTNARPFSEGYAAVAIYKRWGFIDKQGQFLVKPIYKSVGDFSEGVAGVELRNGKLGFIDTSGELVKTTRYDYSELAGFFRPSSRWGFHCDESGESESLDGAYRPSFSEGLFPVAGFNRWGFINKQGKTVIAPRFDAVSPFTNGIAAVRSGYRYNFIDKQGKYLFRRSFPFVSPFRNGLALVFLQWSSREEACGTDDSIVYAYINRNGKRLFVGNYEYWEQFAGDESTALPGVVDVRVESDPEGAQVYLVPWTVWRFKGDKSLEDETWLEPWLQPANTSNTFSVQQQNYMVILKLAGSAPWMRKIQITDTTRNFVRWTRKAD